MLFGRVQAKLAILSHSKMTVKLSFPHNFLNNYLRLLRFSGMIVNVVNSGFQSSAIENLVKWQQYIEKCNFLLQFSIVQPIIYIFKKLFQNNPREVFVKLAT